jgi:hypothetical protein
MSATLKHAQLGELEGNSVDGAVQFLGLKYASLRNRLAAADIVENYGIGSIDATKYGLVMNNPITAITKAQQTSSRFSSRSHRSRIWLYPKVFTTPGCSNTLRSRRPEFEHYRAHEHEWRHRSKREAPCVCLHTWRWICRWVKLVPALQPRINCQDVG